MASKKGPQQDEGFVGTSDFVGGEPASDGWHRFVFAELVDLGMDDKFDKNNPDHRGVLVMPVDEEYEGEGELAGKCKEVRLYFSFTRGLGAIRSNKGGTDLRKRLEEWRGRKFTEAELESFRLVRDEYGNRVSGGLPLGKLIGREGLVMTSIEEAAQSENKFAKIIKLAPAPKSAKENPFTVPSDYVPLLQREKAAGAPKRGGKASETQEPDEGDDPLPF